MSCWAQNCIIFLLRTNFSVLNYIFCDTTPPEADESLFFFRNYLTVCKSPLDQLWYASPIQGTHPNKDFLGCSNHVSVFKFPSLWWRDKSESTPMQCCNILKGWVEHRTWSFVWRPYGWKHWKFGYFMICPVKHGIFQCATVSLKTDHMNKWILIEK